MRPGPELHPPPAGMGADAGVVVTDAQRICLVPAPTFGESERASFVDALLREAGGRPVIDAVGNVLCRFGTGESAHVFAAHLDTVFDADQPEAVSAAPGRLCAPGLGDNSLGVAGLVALARRLVARPPSHPVLLAATVGEEGLGDLRGATHLLATTACETFIAVEGMMLDELRHAGIGSTRLRVTVDGPGGHSWSDRGAPSAVHGLIEAAADVTAWAREQGIGSGSDLSVNLGRIEGGTSINTIAASASVEVDLRGEDPSALAALSAIARERLSAVPEGLRVRIETVGERPSGMTAPDDPLVVLARSVRAGAGLAPAREGASSTDANAAYGAGVPAITVGITTGGNEHRLDEYIDLAPLPQGLTALYALLDGLSAVGPRA